MTNEPTPTDPRARAARADISIAKQLGACIKRNGQLVVALREICAKQKLDAVAAASMQAIAHRALNASIAEDD